MNLHVQLRNTAIGSVLALMTGAAAFSGAALAQDDPAGIS